MSVTQNEHHSLAVEVTMRFKDLSVGTMFEFDRTGFEHSGTATGPWIKLSAKQYTACDTDNALYGHKITVGSVNVKVVEP